MAPSAAIQQTFLHRSEQIPVHGVGLSVDVYSPDLTSLLGLLRQRQVMPAYLEVFRATTAALAAVRREVHDLPLTYHGEGLWLAQPDIADDPVFVQEACETAAHLCVLESAWSNHECATKQMAGYSFGTYLPPLYTPAGAEVVAANARFFQMVLDKEVRLARGCSPLVLLEMAPLTYFAAGTMTVPAFFRLVTEQSACGLVLDVGHLWTLYRYTGAWRTVSLTRFVEEFLDEFPMDRIVEIHVAGLAIHESSLAVGAESAVGGADRLPCWTDAHAAPIPPVLFNMLDQILDHPHLSGLKGLALEVDTKPAGLIADEFETFSRHYASVFPLPDRTPPLDRMAAYRATSEKELSAPTDARNEVRQGYERYALVASGRIQPCHAEWEGPLTCLDELERYRSIYLPYEILHWGGDVEAMFPKSCRRLAERAVPLSRFVSFWFREPRAIAGPYDFFLLKIERFVEFVTEAAPEAAALAAHEADELRQAYRLANEPAVPTASEAR